jgi:hypothetical protein
MHVGGNANMLGVESGIRNMIPVSQERKNGGLPNVQVLPEEECVERGGDGLGCAVAALGGGGQVHSGRVAVRVHTSVCSANGETHC